MTFAGRFLICLGSSDLQMKTKHWLSDCSISFWATFWLSNSGPFNLTEYVSPSQPNRGKGCISGFKVAIYSLGSFTASTDVDPLTERTEVTSKNCALMKNYFLMTRKQIPLKGLLGFAFPLQHKASKQGEEVEGVRCPHRRTELGFRIRVAPSQVPTLHMGLGTPHS